MENYKRCQQELDLLSVLYGTTRTKLSDVAFGIKKVVRGFRQDEELQEVKQPDYVKAKAVPTGFEDLDRNLEGYNRQT